MNRRSRVPFAWMVCALCVLVPTVAARPAAAPARAPTLPPPLPPAVARATVADSIVVGVLPFAAEAVDATMSALAFGLADLLATDLSRSRALVVVERARLGAVLRELDLAARGTVDSATAPRAGRLVQARTLVTGRLSRLGDRDVVFEARVTDVASGRVARALDARAPLADVLAAEKEIALRLFEQVGVVLTPAERALVEQRPTRDLAALVAYGEGARAETNGQYAAAARAYRHAATIDPGFRQAAARARDASARAAQQVAEATADRLNRPLEGVSPTPRPGLPTDPGFPFALQASVTVDITRP